DATDKRFLIASVTKVFTASLVAQAIVRGDIESVDDPVNRYLTRAQLPDNCGQAVTIRHLLTHTAGFEEKGFGVKGPQEVVPLPGADMIAQLPAYARCPGEGVVYANIDPPLLGAMLEDMAGLDLRALMARDLLVPLGMDDTELVYDPSGGSRMLDAFIMEGTQPGTKLGRAINKAFYAPTGSIHTTAADMAKFLSAQLGNQPDVLSGQALAILHSPLASNGPGLMQLGGAFFIGDWNGQTYVDHLGAFSGFNAIFVVAPEKQTGVFIAWGGMGAQPLGFDLEAKALKKIYGPFKDPAPLAGPPPVEDLIGIYWIERRGHKSAEKILSLDGFITVEAENETQLRINGDGPFYAAGGGLYVKQSADGVPGPRYRLDGQSVRKNADYAVRTGGLSGPKTAQRLGLFGLGAMVTGVLGLAWPRKSGRFPALGCTVIALGFALVLYGIGGVQGFVDDLLAGKAWRFVLLSVFSFTSLALAAVLAWGVYDLWRGRFSEAPAWRGWLAKTHSVLLVCGCLSVSYFAW
ncbi:MAG: serine hydrolase domain-containing protein, partial [Pseudomonadota bacterium]